MKGLNKIVKELINRIALSGLSLAPRCALPLARMHLYFAPRRSSLVLPLSVFYPPPLPMPLLPSFAPTRPPMPYGCPHLAPPQLGVDPLVYPTSTCSVSFTPALIVSSILPSAPMSVTWGGTTNALFCRYCKSMSHEIEQRRRWPSHQTEARVPQVLLVALFLNRL
jgi:hypothetical protein